MKKCPVSHCWICVTLKIKTKQFYLHVILHVTRSPVRSAASHWSPITMVTRRVDILKAIKLQLNGSPVFLIEVPLQKARPSAPRLKNPDQSV